MDTAAVDRDVETLRAGRHAWARLPIPEKLRYLDALAQRTENVAERQVRAALAAKGIAPGSPAAAEEWLGGPVVQTRVVRQLRQSLHDVLHHGVPQLPPGSVRQRANGRVAVQVFPATLIDRATLPGFRGEVWMQDGVTPHTLADHMAGFYKQPEPDGAVSLVLGAGNVASIGPLDALDALFVHGRVVLLKFNPVNAYLGPFVEEAFADLIHDGYLRTAYGGADVGAYLCAHPAVDTIHVTGSDKTHDAIVFGPGPEGAKRKRKHQPINTKPITSELGNVSPVVVVPGPFTAAELRFHAENVATQMTNNAGFNCNAAKVLVLSADWPQRRDFLDLLRSVLAALPPRRAYYPGAADRYARFVDAYPGAEVVGAEAEGALPWTLLMDVDAREREQPAFREESFCGVTAVTTLPGRDARGFLKRAVDFCNETLWGTLNACLIVHPRTRAALGPAFDQALEALRYGSIGVNHWPALSYGLGTTTWGAYPGHTADDIQSGVGVVHDTYLFDRPEKSIIEGPFRISPKPPWFVTHGNAAGVARALLHMERSPSLLRLPGLVWQAVRG